MDVFTTLLIAGFFFIMGAAVVGLIWYLKGVSKGMRGNSKTASPADPNLAEVARLMRHLQTQDLVVEIDGKLFKAAHELSPAQQRRLSFTSNVLTEWLVKPAPEPKTEETPAKEPSVTWAEQTPLEFLPMPAEAEPVEHRSGYTPPFSTEPAMQVKPVSTELPDLVGGMLKPTPKPAPEFKSIAAQINDILQVRLVGTPLESRGITLSDAPGHGVMVSVDGKLYPGVRDVPDEEVRAAIRAAVLEWETKK